MTEGYCDKTQPERRGRFNGNAEKCQGTTSVVPITKKNKERASAPAMTKPSRPADPQNVKGEPRTFFVTTSTAGGRSLFQSTRMAELFIEVLRSYVRTQTFTIHEFVVMPNHVHILLTAPGELSIEKAMQLVKGGFSFRANKELGFSGEIWQRGFSDVRIVDVGSFEEHRVYIHNNPVKAGLVKTAEEYPFGTAYLKARKTAGAKAPSVS